MTWTPRPPLPRSWRRPLLLRQLLLGAPPWLCCRVWTPPLQPCDVCWRLRTLSLSSRHLLPRTRGRTSCPLTLSQPPLLLVPMLLLSLPKPCPLLPTPWLAASHPKLRKLHVLRSLLLWRHACRSRRR